MRTWILHSFDESVAQSNQSMKPKAHRSNNIYRTKRSPTGFANKHSDQPRTAPFDDSSAMLNRYAKQILKTNVSCRVKYNTRSKYKQQCFTSYFPPPEASTAAWCKRYNPWTSRHQRLLPPPGGGYYPIATRHTCLPSPESSTAVRWKDKTF